MTNDSQSINDILTSIFKCAMTEKKYIISCAGTKNEV